MNEILFIRLSDGSDPVTWCLQLPQTGYGHVQSGSLDDALLLARNRQVAVLVPSADIVLTTVELPAQLQSAPPARLLQAIPYLLEDRLAEDVETLHFATGRKSSAAVLPVAITARARIEGWLKPFKDRGITPSLLVPDVLCVPLAPAAGNGQWSVLIEGGQASVRSAAQAGFSCETEMLGDFLTLGGAPDDLKLQVYPVERSELPTLKQVSQTTAASVTHGLEYLLRGYDPGHCINLLQGEHAAATDYSSRLRPWRVTAALLLAWLLLGVLGMGVEYLRLRHELNGFEKTAENAFRAAFPQITRIVDLPAQARQQLLILNRAGGQGGFLPLMQASSQTLARINGIQVQEIQFREGVLHLALQASDTQALDRLQQGFAQQPGLRLEVESANASGQGVQIRAAVKTRQ